MADCAFLTSVPLAGLQVHCHGVGALTHCRRGTSVVSLCFIHVFGGVAGAISSIKANASDSTATSADRSVKKGSLGTAATACWVGPHIYIWLDVFTLNQHVQHGVMADLGVVGEVLRTCDRGVAVWWKGGGG